MHKKESKPNEHKGLTKVTVDSIIPIIAYIITSTQYEVGKRRQAAKERKKTIHVWTKCSSHTLIFMQHMLVSIHLYFSRLRSPLFLSPPLSLSLLSPHSHEGFFNLHTTPCFT